MSKLDSSVFNIETFDARRKEKLHVGETQQTSLHHPQCDRPGCQETGLYKAARSPRNLKEYRYLCLDHIREHNKKWNFCDGMSESEIMYHIEKDMVGHRPTWQHGASKHHKNQGSNGFNKTQRPFKFDDPFNLADKIFDDYTTSHSKNSDSTDQKTIHRNTLKKIHDACTVLSITFPPDLKELKQHYKKLVKKYHPDINKEDKSANQKLKEVVDAYKIISDYLSS